MARKPAPPSEDEEEFNDHLSAKAAKKERAKEARRKAEEGKTPAQISKMRRHRIYRRIFYPFTFLFTLTFYTLWSLFLILLFAIPVLILWIPWTFITRTRPRLWIVKKDEKGKPHWGKSKKRYRAGDSRAEELKDVFALPGKGIEREAPPGRRVWAFFKGRCWEVYELTRACWRSVSRQGLQIGGVICGVTIIGCQVELMRHDFGSDAIRVFYEANYGGKGDENPGDLIRTDENCPYVPGTGVANWGDNLENLVWYGLYHGGLCLLSLMLICQEVFNVRFGLWAPQWSRMGEGHTIMFLVAATLSTSSNYGTGLTIRFRYVLLVSLFMFGVYNLLRGYIAGADLTHHTYADQTYRNRRHSIHTWTESQWQTWKYRADFRVRRPGDEPKWWSEKMQLAIGDHCPLNQKKDREMWHRGQKGGRVSKRYAFSAGEIDMQAGTVGRSFWHGYPIELPAPSDQDMIDFKPYSRFKNWASFRGIHHWHPFRRRIDAKDQEAEDATYDYRRTLIWARCCCKWFDLRRILACVCAFCLFAIHIGLLCDFTLLTQWKAYKAGYEDAQATWKEDGQLADDACQYYSGTHLAIFPQPGVGYIRGVMNNMLWLVLWHIWMLGLCIGVFLVAFTNCRVFGMHLPWPVSLLGPRLSSNGIGWTLGFIAFATLQIGLFSEQPPIVLFICRWVCYVSIVTWVLYLMPNEPLGNNFVREPFWNRLSERAFVMMESKQYHKELHNFAHY